MHDALNGNCPRGVINRKNTNNMLYFIQHKIKHFSIHKVKCKNRKRRKKNQNFKCIESVHVMSQCSALKQHGNNACFTYH